MRWEDGRRSTNIEDRRGSGLSRGVKIGGIGGVVVVLIALLLGGDPAKLLEIAGTNTGVQSSIQSDQPRSAEEQQLADFVSVVLGDTEDTWRQLFQKMGRRYIEPRLVMFTGSVESACGNAESAVGPFYCPGDQKVYIDLSFYRDLKSDLNLQGDTFSASRL